jgi:glycosyltransferase involved in cell wall biosynthesis
MKPKVSIITPLQNKGPYIAETIHAVLAQTMREWEMIIVENGSHDNGPSVVKTFSDPRIHLVVSPKLGPGAARNCGLDHATGDWILFLDADDLIEASYLSDRLKSAQENPSAVLVAGCWEEFSSDINVRTFHRPTGLGGSRSDLENSAIAAAPWALHSTIVQRNHLTSDLKWPEEMDRYPSEDTAFWFPLILGASVAFTEKAGALYRVQTENSRNNIIDINNWVVGVIAVINRNVGILKQKNLDPNQQQVASIVRTLESNYRMAIRRSDRFSSNLAFIEANAWLRRCHYHSLVISFRKILGLRISNFLRFGII